MNVPCDVVGLEPPTLADQHVTQVTRVNDVVERPIGDADGFSRLALAEQQPPIGDFHQTLPDRVGVDLGCGGSHRHSPY